MKMVYSPQALLLIFPAVFLLFGIVICLGLSVRKKRMAENLAIRAQTVWAPLINSDWRESHLLYGIWQDDTALTVKMVVRNFKDEEIGNVILHHAQTPCKSFETLEGNFEADILPKMSTTVEFHSIIAGSESLCTYARKWGVRHRFEIKGLGFLESGRPQFTLAGPKFTYHLNGKKIGIKHPIGQSGTPGRLVVFPEEIPLPVQIFILAM